MTLEYCRRNFKYVVPLPAVNQVMTVCKVLEGILPTESVRGAPPPDKKLLETNFVFACVWAFGGCMLVDKVGQQCCSFTPLIRAPPPAFNPSPIYCAPSPLSPPLSSSPSPPSSPPQVYDYRTQFSKWWISEWKNVQVGGLGRQVKPPPG